MQKRWKLEEWQALLIGFALLHILFNVLVMPALIPIPDFWFKAINLLITAFFIALPVFLLTKKRIEFQPVKHSVITPLFFICGCVLVQAIFNTYIYQLVLNQPVGSGAIQNPGAYPVSAINDAYTVFNTLVKAPLVEETIYRLGLLGALAIVLGRFPALLISSAAFAVAHMGRLDSLSLAPYFVGGLLLGLTYLLYGPVWVAIAHLFFNLLSYLDSKGYVDIALDGPIGTMAVSVLAISGLFIFFQQNFKNRRDFGRFSSRS